MKFPLFIFFLLICVGTYGQKVIDVDKDDVNVASLYYTTGSHPVSKAKYIRVVEGSPYFNPSWLKGSLVLGNDVEYRGIMLRLDLLANAIEYIDRKGNELVTTTPVKKITLTDTVTGVSTSFFHSALISNDAAAETGWYQVLENGKAILYKHVKKSIHETQPYGSATIEQKIESIISYYLVFNDSLVRIRKWKDLPGLLSDRKEKMDSFIKSEKLYGKTDNDYSSVVAYYNSLFK